MTEVPPSIAPAGDDRLLDRILGATALRLLADKNLLLFDVDGGTLVAANDAAQM